MTPSVFYDMDEVLSAFHRLGIGILIQFILQKYSASKKGFIRKK
jgi:hypothetical protein